MKRNTRIEVSNIRMEYLFFLDFGHLFKRAPVCCEERLKWGINSKHLNIKEELFNG